MSYEVDAAIGIGKVGFSLVPELRVAPGNRLLSVYYVMISRYWERE